jgi:hypothetical protein
MLLPTPDGYAGFVQYSPSPLVHEAEERARLTAAQVDVSYTGTLPQWQAHLRRRALLPAGFNDVKLDSTPKWTLHSRRFVSAVPPAVLALSDKSQMSLTMGFMNDGPRVVWDIKEVWWSRDDRKIAAVGLWRRDRPPSSAKLELRTKFASMRDRRSPYDGQISHETTEEFAISKVLDVPGKKAGTVASDLLYGITLHFEGLPAHNDSGPSSMIFRPTPPWESAQTRRWGGIFAAGCRARTWATSFSRARPAMRCCQQAAARRIP